MAEDGTTHWMNLYQAALLELDVTKLRQRVGLAETAVRERQKLLMLDRTTHAAEERSLVDALQNLRVLRNESDKGLKSA